MFIHGYCEIGAPNTTLKRVSFFDNISYIVGI